MAGAFLVLALAIGPRAWVDLAVAGRFGAPLVEPTALPAGALLVDARAPAEFAESHLPGAIHATSVDAVAAARGRRPVVVYCSVAWRSGQLADALRAQGIDARNLRGGIFRWAREGRPLRDGAGNPTRRVHPFGFPWGLLR